MQCFMSLSFISLFCDSDFSVVQFKKGPEYALNTNCYGIFSFDQVFDESLVSNIFNVYIICELFFFIYFTESDSSITRYVLSC